MGRESRYVGMIVQFGDFIVCLIDCVFFRRPLNLTCVYVVG